MSPRKPKYTELTAQVDAIKAMRCDRCVYWDGDKSDIIPVRECRKPLVFWDASHWLDGERVPTTESADIKMFVQDGSDYRAILLTRADFFCAHFERIAPEAMIDVTKNPV